MKHRVVFLAALALVAFSRPAMAGSLFDQIMSGGGRKTKEQKSADAAARKFKFTVHLTTGDVLKAIEYVGGGMMGRRAGFRFMSNFESDITVKLPFVKYVDMDMIGEEVLSAEYAEAKADRVYLKNKDYVTGKIEGFTAGDIKVATTYGDLKVDITQVRYMMFRNPATGPAPETPKPAKAAKKAAEPVEAP